MTENERQALHLAIELEQARSDRAEEITLALRRLGTDAWPALPMLVSMLRRAPQDGSWRRLLPVLALIHEGSDVIVPAVSEFLHFAPSAEARLLALQCLRSFPAQLAPAMDVLLELGEGLDGDEVATQALFVAALDGAALAPHADHIRRLFAIPPVGARSAAVACLGAMLSSQHSLAPEDLRAIVDVAGSPDTEEAVEALEALARIGPRGAIVAQDLVSIAAKDDSLVSRRALDALFAMGSAASHVAESVSRLHGWGQYRVHQLRAVAAMDREVLVRRFCEWPVSSCHELDSGIALAEIGPSIRALLDAMLEFESGSKVESALALVALRELARRGDVDALARWIPLKRPDPEELGLDLLLESRFDSNGSDSSALALALFDPRLRERVAARLARHDDLPDSMLPHLLAWILDPEAGQPALLALARAGGSRPWLRSLLWHRLATIPVDARPGLAQELASALSA